jgi:hypothetical protein
MRRKHNLALLLAVVLVLAVGAVACGGGGGPSAVTPTESPAGTPAEATASATGTPSPDAATKAVMAVIQKANEEQQLALAQHDPTIMRDTATAAYYSLLVQAQQVMEAAGVTAIKLNSLEWGPVTVQGTDAQAATTETWQVDFADGSSQKSSDRNAYVLVQQGGAWLIAGDAQAMSSVGESQSVNWAGYAATGGPFTAVSGTWTVPQVNASSPSGSGDATWVGIGGVVSTDLIQAGTDATVAAAGQVSYTAWVEMLPSPTQTVPLTVEAGDVITVSIAQQATGSWQISISNQTTGQNYQTTVQYSSSLSSAEWVEEAPLATASARVHIVTLDNFGQVRFQAAGARLGGQQVTIAATDAQPLTMSDQSGTIASPSALGSDGASFTVTRTSNP